MQKLTAGLLFGAYVFLAMTVAALMWRGGMGVGAASAGLFGALGFAFSLHALISGAMGRAALRREVEGIRQAYQLLADAVESTQGSVAELAGAVEKGAVGANEALTDEVRILEDLVHRMSASLDARQAEAQASVTHSPDTFEGRRQRQAAALMDTVREALTDNRVDLYLQPVVTLPQRKTVFYESFTRLRDTTGRVMMPAEYLSIAEGEGLVPAIDNLLLFRCAQIVRRLAKQDRRVGVFCNVSPASLADETFFPQFLDFLRENADLRDALIFEMGQAAFDARGAVEARNMAKLADLGFRFSIDKVQTLDLDYADLQRSDVKFIKIGADLLLEQLLDLEGGPALASLRDIHASDFAGISRRYGMEVIAEKVEAERQVVDILELDIGYAQGNLFGEPRAIKEQVLAEAEPSSDFIRSTLQATQRRRRFA
ncbi:EAL domain-containing protein [Brevundimonas sp. 2R-24]|uniref:EAL domain-containing protein n=1 Tax=Peiella sedimenti TaxID=3061083 RepID=A0ABT8SJT9_9CAUL|nr:EAL domain-containing protein [Caulobacteraceae bacterium XZ-24]